MGNEGSLYVILCAIENLQWLIFWGPSIQFFHTVIFEAFREFVVVDVIILELVQISWIFLFSGKLFLYLVFSLSWNVTLVYFFEQLYIHIVFTYNGVDRGFSKFCACTLGRISLRCENWRFSMDTLATNINVYDVENENCVFLLFICYLHQLEFNISEVVFRYHRMSYSRIMFWDI